MEKDIRLATEKALATLGATGVSFQVEWPADMSHGDYSVNAAMAAAKHLGRSPRELAEELAQVISRELGEHGTRVEVAGPGFINIFTSRARLMASIEHAASAGSEWGRGDARQGERVMIEYSNPNPFKEMHLGHLMGTIIGEAVSRIIEASGAQVLRDTYGGDVGPHVARTLWALRKDGVGSVTSASEVDAAYLRGAAAYEASETAQTEIDLLNNELYEGTNEELMALWRQCREVCLAAFQDLYRVLGTKFDYYFFESETAPIGMEVVHDALEKGIFEQSEGAVIYRGEKKGLHTLVFVTSRGTPTYETKDIGLAFLKEQRAETDEVIIVTGQEQVGHFKVFLAALEEIAPLVAKKTHHVPHGLLQRADGKMSSRKGNVITAAEFLRGVIELAAARNEDPLVAEQVAVGAVKYMILRSAPGGDIIFDPEKSLSLEGDSGPYLQYALVRARSILAQSSTTGASDEVPTEPYLLERMLARFPELNSRAEALRAPHSIVQYLTQLAGEWNSFYAAERINGGEHEIYKRHIARAFVTTMENGLWLLGIPAPERM